jgi:hypothetical protein
MLILLWPGFAVCLVRSPDDCFCLYIFLSLSGTLDYYVMMMSLQNGKIMILH